MKSALHYLIAARQCEIGELEHILRTSTLVHQIGQLIHALQKERGLSNIVLASGGARGRAACQAQITASEACAQTVRDSLEQLELGLQGGHGARLFSRIAYLLQGLDALPLLRAHIGRLELAPEDATNAFIRLIVGLLAVVFEAADGVSDPGTSRLLVAMFHFMQGKELAGQERATGAAAFGAGRAEAARRQHWLHLIDAQERCFQVFAEFAPPAPVAQWQERCLHLPCLATIERLRRVACTAPDGGLLDSSASEAWFDACTERMDAMQAIAEQLADALLQHCAQQLQAARSSLAQQQALLAQPPAAPDLVFFSQPVPDPALALEGSSSPQLDRSVLALVQEQSQRLHAMQGELETARTALNERKTLERAKGLLMAHRQLTESEAHKLLRQTAMNQNRRLIDVAEAVLAMADLLPPAQP